MEMKIIKTPIGQDNKAKFDKNWDRIFKVRKGTKAKQTQFHKDRKKEEKKNPSGSWTDEFRL